MRPDWSEELIGGWLKTKNLNEGDRKMTKSWPELRIKEMEECRDNSFNSFTYPCRTDYECRGVEDLADRLFVMLDHPEDLKYSYRRTVAWLDHNAGF